MRILQPDFRDDSLHRYGLIRVEYCRERMVGKRWRSQCDQHDARDQYMKTEPFHAAPLYAFISLELEDACTTRNSAKSRSGAVGAVYDVYDRAYSYFIT